MINPVPGNRIISPVKPGGLEGEGAVELFQGFYIVLGVPFGKSASWPAGRKPGQDGQSYVPL